MVRPLPGQAPLVGRVAELAQLSALMTQLEAGQGWVVSLLGEAGVGKSRLVQEFGLRARAEGQHVLIGFCDEDGRQDPAAPYVEALRSGLRAAPHLADTVKRSLAASCHALLPELLGETGQVVNDRPLLAEGIRRCLEAFAEDGGTLLIVEDVHLATRGTLSILRRITRDISQVRIGVLVTWRKDNPEADGLLHSFELNPQTRASLAARIELRPLTWAETRQFVAVLLGQHALPPTSLIDQLYERTEGNPFYIEELMHAAEDDGRVRADAMLPDRLPPTLGGVLSQRFDKLGARGQRVLGAAAIFGRRFSAESLVEVAGLDGTTVERALEGALRLEIIAEQGSGFTFRHALLQEAAAAHLLGSQRRRLHLRIAHAHEREQTQFPGRAATLAYHYGRANDHEAQLLYAERAGDDAEARNDPREAAVWYSEAIRLADSVSDEEPLALLEKAARVFVRNWRLDDARVAYDRLITARRESGDTRALGETLAASSMVYFNNPQMRLDRLRAALEILEPLGNSPALARAQAWLATAYLNVDNQDALDVGLAALSVAAQTGTDDAAAIALRAVGTWAAQGEIGLGAALLRESIRLSAEEGLNVDAYLASLNLSSAYARAAMWAEAEAVMMPSYRAAGRQNVPDAIGTSLVRLAQVKRLSGDWLAADELVAQARLRIDETDVSARMLFAFEAAYLSLGRGRWHEAISTVQPLVRQIDEKDQKLDIAAVRDILAQACVGSGDIEGAVGHVRAMLAALDDVGSYSVVIFLPTACETLCMAGHAVEAKAVIDNLTALMARLSVLLNPERIRGLLPHQYKVLAGGDRAPSTSLSDRAQAVWHWCRAALDSIDGRHEAASQEWEQSLPYWRTAGLTYEAAECQVRLGLALLAAGRPEDRDRARDALTEGGEVFRALDARRLQFVEALLRKHRLVAPEMRRAGPELSRREREVLALVAQGLANRRIAEALVLSPRTVEHHVSRLLSKLGLATRASLAAYAVERGLVGVVPPGSASGRD